MRKSILMVTIAVWAATADAALPPLIPRESLFGASLQSRPRLSPDGTRLSWLAADDRGVINVWVQTIGKNDARPVTNEARRPPARYEWSPDGKSILYFQDADGDENDHLFSADVEGLNVRDLTPFRGVRAMNLITSAARPGNLLIALNVRDRRFFDMYRVDLDTGALRLVAQNPGDVISWTADSELNVRALTAFDAATARTVVRVRDHPDRPWRDLISWPFERSPVWYGQVDGGTMIVNFTPDGKGLHVLSAATTDTLQLVRVDVSSGAVAEVVASDERADVMEAPYPALGQPMFLAHPQTGRLEAVAFQYLEPRWHVLEDSLRGDFARISRQIPGFIRVISRDTRDQKWIVHTVRSDQAPQYHLYDRETGTLTALFSARPALAEATLAAAQPLMIRARDGVELPSYLTLPTGVPPRKLPLIVFPHGGPWERDVPEFDPMVQFFANRGYAVLQVNYRGSSGFGMRFLNLFTGEWSGKVIDDLADGARWVIGEGIVDPDRVGAYGNSGGGYATLFLMARYPDLFRAGGVGVAPMNIRDLVAQFPVYWVPGRERWLRRVGNVLTDEAVNRSVSPIFHAGAIKGPLLLSDGANDPRRSAMAEFVSLVRKTNPNVTFVVYTDEGHSFSRPENQMDHLGRIEHFFARHLGGRAEPMTAIEGASVVVQ